CRINSPGTRGTVVASRVLPNLYRVFSGDLAVFGGPVLEESAAGRIRAEQVGVIRRYLPWMMLANAFNAVVLVAALWKSPDKSLALGWASLVIGFAALHGRKASGASGQSPVSERTVRRAVGNAFLLGSLWAALPVVFFRRRIEQRATRHHLPMRRDAGGR